MSVAVVWLKRDLRLQDHQPLCRAAATGLPVVLVYCFEPMLLDDPHYSARHWRFVAESLINIQKQVPQGTLLCVQQDAIETFHQIHQKFGIHSLYSHQEVGLNNTFVRDKTVARWCYSQHISWYESQFGAVIRGLKHRETWDKAWDKVMRAPTENIDVEHVNWLIDSSIAEQTQLTLARYTATAAAANDYVGNFQRGGEEQAWQVLNSFYQSRGKGYAYNLSSPTFSQQHCSRLSPYLAWGNISLRQVYQSVLQHWQVPGWRRSLAALSSRLHWHCHFIQKFESESDMEFRPINRGYEALPRLEGKKAVELLCAWEQGITGIPMVDACMRCLIHTGYLNFRMRAMLVSFLCHHLEIDWRAGVQHLARVFLDFEPGIHYSQFQMQAGITGINTIRIYNPVKQGEEKDPEGVFVKTWLPELAQVPAPLVHSPWELTEMEQIMYEVRLGEDYPKPIIDLKKSYKSAKALLWSWRKKPLVKKEAKRLLATHVRPSV